jgi:hypothetical protein
MARKRDRNHATVAGKPVASPDDSFAVGLREEKRRQDRPAFKARLAAAKSDAGWQQFKRQFKRIAAEHAQPKAAAAVPQEWKDAVVKRVPSPPPLKPAAPVRPRLLLKAWFKQNRDKYTLDPGELVESLYTRMAEAAVADGVRSASWLTVRDYDGDKSNKR